VCERRAYATENPASHTPATFHSSIWYEVHLTAPVELKGFTLPALQWSSLAKRSHRVGFTKTALTWSGSYVESVIPPDDNYRVMSRGMGLITTHREVIPRQRSNRRTFDVTVTRRPYCFSRGRKRIRRCRLERRRNRGGLRHSYNWLGTARNCARILEAMKRVWDGAERVYADIEGKYRYVMAARVPIRRWPLRSGLFW